MNTKTQRNTGLAAKGEAAKYLGVSRPTLEKLIKQGAVETRCTGCHKKVTWHSVYVYLGEIESNSEQ